MGRRSDIETVVKILAAFHERDEWPQPELMARVGVTQNRTVRLILLELSAAGLPFERIAYSGREVSWRCLGMPPFRRHKRAR